MIHKNFAIATSLLTLFSCNTPGGNVNQTSKNKSVYINDYNVLFVPDLSNRINQSIHPKPTNDTTILFNTLDNIISLIDLNNRTINQKDIYKIDFINKNILNSNICNPEQLEINLNKFETDPAGASEYLRSGIKNDVALFKSNIKSIYDYSLTNSAGADLWNYFNETINTSVKNTSPVEIISDSRTADEPIYFKQYKNVIVLLTDGYIENANKTKGYNLDAALIEKIRKDFITNENKSLKEFILSKPEYQLNKTNNDLSGLNVLVLETIDRSLDKNGVALKQPTDFQIMKILWEEWLMSSGADKVEVHQAVRKKEEGYILIKTFMEHL